MAPAVITAGADGLHFRDTGGVKFKVKEIMTLDEVIKSAKALPE